MGVVLVLGTLLLIGVLVYRIAVRPQPGAPAGFGVVDIDVPPGMAITQVDLDGDRMVLHVTSETQDEVLLIDSRTGTLIGRLRLKERIVPGQGP